MAKKIKKNHIEIAMDTLGVSASELTRASGVDTSLINKWRRGDRRMTKRSSVSINAAKALVELDRKHELEPLYAPYRTEGGTDAQAMLAYLMDEEVAGLTPQAAQPTQPKSGIYTAQYRVYLGQKGFRQAGLDTLDYALRLPPSTLTVLAQGKYEWFTGSIPYLLRFLRRLKKVFAHGTRMQMINRRGYSMAETAAFAGPWLVAHLKGYIRSRYYDGELPENVRFAASIKGYFGLHAEEDPYVEDNLYLSMQTDPRETRQYARMCEEYLEKSVSASQYGFFAQPEGSGENPKLWKQGPLPAWEGGKKPRGNFYAINCVPGIGIMTQEEFERAAGGGASRFPGYLFSADGAFSKGKHRIILCREDVRQGLKKERRMHEVLSAILGRRAFVTRDMLAAQLERLVRAAQQHDDFEVALMPKTAFKKLQIEMVCWQDSATIGWLQDMGESVFSNDMATSGAFQASIDYAWDKLLAGWKRKSTVLRNLRKWLAGKELDQQEKDSAIVENWDVLPKE